VPDSVRSVAVKRRSVEELFPALESGDAFLRLAAEKRLRALLLHDFGFRWDGPPGDRTAALERIKGWLAEAARKEKERLKAFPGLAAVDLQSLKGLSPAEVEQHLQELLGKAKAVLSSAAGRPLCEECGKRLATVEIVEVRQSRARGVRRICDPCGEKPL